MNTGSGANRVPSSTSFKTSRSDADKVPSSIQFKVSGSSSSRGYYKIKDAVLSFGFDFRGKVVLDIGSSTGGFTKYALEQGAKKVIAVEKGTNQMEAPLRFDPRVELHEKTDIFRVEVDAGFILEAKTGFLQPEEREFLLRCENQKLNLLPQFPDVIVADVSFLSLTKILEYAKMKLTRSDTDYLVMLKPQFEAKPHELKNGIVKNHQIRRQIVKNFEKWLKQNGFVIIKKRDNVLKGKNGNEERFYWLRVSC